MENSILLILIALLQYCYFILRVGFARGKYNVSAPKTTGHEVWECYYRVQMNTMEQLIIFIPSVIIFTQYVSEKWVLLPGILFIIGRQVYSTLYIKNPASRGPGVVLSFFSNIGMVIASIIAIVMNMLG